MTTVIVEQGTPTPISVKDDKQIRIDLAVSPITLVKDSQGLSVVKSDDTSVRIDNHIPPITFVACGEQGPPGPSGSGEGGIFVLDVTPTSTGIVSDKEYDSDTVPSNIVVERAITDTSNIRISVGCNGGSNNYSPSATVAGVPVIFTETSTKRWFTGYADVALIDGINILPVISDTGGTAEVTIEKLGGGPSIQSIVFGSYPGVQTELKSGDQISVTITTDIAATSVTILNQGATTGTTLPVSGGIATGNITISGLSGSQPITAKARNSFGTFGNEFISTPLTLNQTYPTFGSFSVNYPIGQSALKGVEEASASITVSDFDTITYSSAQVAIPNSTTYEVTKIVTNDYLGYIDSGTNYTITANRAANDSTTVASNLIKIASVAATAEINIDPPGRLVSSPTGIPYTVSIIPSQELSSPPDLDASLGAWIGSWVLSDGTWSRDIIISDSTLRGGGLFSGLVVNNLAGILGNTITTGSGYVVGGFTLRTVTFPAFSRVATLGVSVVDESKTSAWSQGGVQLTRQTDTVSRTNGYYIADASGNYSPTGSYIALADTAIVGANTSGTLTATIQEAA